MKRNGRANHPALHYGGVLVGKVFSYDRGRGVADALLMHSPVGGTSAHVRADRVTGRLRLGRAGTRELTAGEVVAELERRAGVAFGTAPAADPEPSTEAA